MIEEYCYDKVILDSQGLEEEGELIIRPKQYEN